jgi:ATP-binding cassette subfamily B protein
MVFVLTYSFIVDRRVGVAYILLLPIMMLTTLAMSRQIKKAQETISKESNTIAGSITESIRNVSLIKMLGLVGQEIKRLDEGNNKVLDLELKKVQTVRLIEFIQGTLINAMRVGLIGLLGYLVYTQAITVGELMSLYFYSFFLFGQLSLFGTVVKNYQEARANHDILQDIMNQEKEKPTDHLEKLGTIKSLGFDAVSFSYTPDKQVLNNISFDTKSGQTIAFV